MRCWLFGHDIRWERGVEGAWCVRCPRIFIRISGYWIETARATWQEVREGAVDDYTI